MTWTDDLRDLKVMCVDCSLWITALTIGITAVFRRRRRRRRQTLDYEADMFTMQATHCLWWINGLIWRCLFILPVRSQSSVPWIMRWKHDLTAALNLYRFALSRVEQVHFAVVISLLSWCFLHDDDCFYIVLFSALKQTHCAAHRCGADALSSFGHMISFLTFC